MSKYEPKVGNDFPVEGIEIYSEKLPDGGKRHVVKIGKIVSIIMVLTFTYLLLGSDGFSHVMAAIPTIINVK